MPTFPNLNGQIKVPLRFYSDERLTSWNASACKETFQAKPYTIISIQEALPPFQFWKDTSDATIVSWEVVGTETGSVLADLSTDITLIQKEEFSEQDYWIYSGQQLTVPLPTTDPNTGLYCRIEFSDGQVYFSELFRTTCEIPSDSEPVFDWDFQHDGPLIGWGVGSTGNEADDHWPLNGDPVVTPFEGMVVVNTGDGLLYTYTSGAWATSTPSDGDYRLVKSNGLFYQWSSFTSTWSVMSSPPVVQSGTGACFQEGDNPDAIGLSYTGIEYGDGPWVVTVRVGVFSTGSINIIIGDVDQTLSSGTNSIDVTTISDDSILFAPTADFNGCLISVEVRRSAVSLLCNLKLEWTNCGNVGGIFYEEGFINGLFLEREVEIIRPTVSISTENTENGRKDQIQDFFRKEVEWKIPFGQVPWHIVDAISEIPAHNTITLTLKYGQGVVTMTRLRVVASWPDGSNATDCYQNLDLYFQVDEATVATACCDEFDPPCDPEVEPGEITGITCFNDDCSQGLVITADIAGGYFGQLYISTDDGATWSEGDLDLSSEAWENNEIPVEPGDQIFAIRVYRGDCEVGITDEMRSPCEDGFFYEFSILTTDSDPGPGGVKFNDNTIGSVTGIFIDDLDKNLQSRAAYWNAAIDQLVITNRDTGATTNFNISSVTDAAGYTKLTVTWVSGVLPSDGEGLCMSYRAE